MEGTIWIEKNSKNWKKFNKKKLEKNNSSTNWKNDDDYLINICKTDWIKKTLRKKKKQKVIKLNNINWYSFACEL